MRSYHISVDTIENYIKLAQMIPELEDLVATRFIISAKLRTLISNNFGRRKNNPAKDRKALETYVELKGYKPSDNQWSAHNGLTLDEIAKQLGISKTNLKRALRIERNLTDSMKELLDTGEMRKVYSLLMPKEYDKIHIRNNRVAGCVDLYSYIEWG